MKAEFIKYAVLASVSALLLPLSAVTTGSSEEYPKVVKPSTESQSLSVTVTKMYDECMDIDSNGNCKPGYSSDFYTYYVKATLTKGQAYTFTATYLNENMYGAQIYFSDYSLDAHWNSGEDASGYSYDQFTVLSSDWDDVESNTVECFIEFSGDSGGKATLSYKIGVDIAAGLKDNPAYLYPGSGFSTFTGTLTPEHLGQYICYATLEAGRKYRFRTTSGTAAYPADMTILPSDAAQDDAGVASNNVGYVITPKETERYEISIDTDASSFALEYGAYPTRPVTSHEAVSIAAGKRTEFYPGHMNAADSDYYDTIIDETLFSFAATAGRRYFVATDSATVPLRMELYDSSGSVLASNTGVKTGDRNVIVAFQAGSTATYYVGVCQNVADDDEIEAVRAGITILDVTDYTDGRTDVAAAVSLMPVVSATDGLPGAIDPQGTGPYSLSPTVCRNVFAIAARTGWNYSLSAALSGSGSGNGLSASVFTMSGSSEVAVRTDGDVDTAYGIGWTADANTTYYVRIRPTDANGYVTEGLEAGPYTLHAAATPPSGVSSFAMLTVNAKGPTSEDGATWRISSGTSGSEPYYPFGTTIPVVSDSASYTVSFSSVSGLSTPSSKSVAYAAGSTNVVTAVYSDNYDSGDDTISGANRLYFGSTAQTATTRTLWTEDPADWYVFSASAGLFYDVSFTEYSGGPRIAITDADGNELAYGTESARLGATAGGTYYVKVSHGSDAEKVDSTYRLSYRSTDVGYVSFSNNGAYTATKGAGYVELVVNRSSSGGALRLDYGTASGTATPGEDYAPTNGTLRWEDGDRTSRTIRVPLIPDVREVNEGNEKFYVKIAAKQDAVLEAGEYPAIVSGTPVAEVTIADTADAAAGTISISSHGAGMEPLVTDAVTVRTGDTAVFWVSREGGSNGTAKVQVTVDGELLTVLRWESGESGAKMFAVKTSSGCNACGPSDDETVAEAEVRKVKIESVEGGFALGRSVVKLNVDPDAAAISYPGDDDELRLAGGSFLGALRSSNGVEGESPLAAVAKVAFSAAESGLSATVDVAGVSYAFAAASYDEIDEDLCSVTFTLEHEVNGETYVDTLWIECDNYTFSSMNGSMYCENSAELSLHLPAADGVSAIAGEWYGNLCRDNRGLAENTAASSVVKGRYTVAFIPSETPYDDEPSGNGYAVLEIAGDGSVAGAAYLADGTVAPIDSFAGFDTDFVSGINAIVPIYFCADGTAFGGNLYISEGDGDRPVVLTRGYETEHGFVMCCAGDSQTYPSCQDLILVGGYYDPSADSLAMLNGKSVFAMTEDGDAYFSAGIEGLGFAVDKATGIATASFDLGGEAASFSGVVIHNMKVDSEMPSLEGLFATGMLATESATHPFSIYADVSDSDNSEDYGLMSAVSFNGNGNTSGYAPDPVEAAVGSIEYIPPSNDNFLRSGYTFLGWTDGSTTWQPGDEIKMPVSNVVLRAKWTISVEGVAEAFGCPGREFWGDGAAGWHAQTNVFVAGVAGNTSALRSGAIGSNQETWIETTVEGSGMLSFYWLVSSEQNYDKLVVTVDGATVGEWSGTDVADWTLFTHEIGSAGSHAVRWTYKKDSSGDKGEDAAWIDLFKFGPTVTVTFDANGGTLATNAVKYVIGEKYGTLPEPDYGELASFDGWEDEDGNAVDAEDEVPGEDVTLYARVKEKEWKVSFDANGATGSVPAALSGIVGTLLSLPDAGSLSKAGYEFGGWSDGSKIFAAGSSYTIGERADVTLSAVWSLSVNGIADALNAPKTVTFSADGDAPWFPAETEIDGRTAVQSGAIGHNGKTMLSANFSGSGYLSFTYRVSSERGSDKLTIAIDGSQLGVFSGEVGWTLVERELGDGDHTVTWTYTKDGSVDSGSDAAWISEFKFGPTVTVTFDAKGGTMEKTAIKYVAGEPFGTLPEPEYDELHTFSCWTYADGTEAKESDIVPETDVALVAVVKESEGAKAVRETLGGNVDFAMSGTPSWFAQSDTVPTGASSAMRSGAIGNSASTTLTVAFSGAGDLSFEYKVSSEKNYDKLTISIDGETVGAFSGDIDWTLVERALEDGSHTVVLTYAKDSSTTSGSDAAWLGNFSWAPAVAPEPDGWNTVTVDGKEKVADHDKAKAWCEANDVELSDFASSYDDYLLNQAPGSGGGIEISAIERDVQAGKLTITVGRTKDSFALDAMNGTLVLYFAESLGKQFEAVSSVDVAIEAEAASATVTVDIPESASGFYRAKVE